MNRLWITLSSLIMAPLCAETVGNLNFQFPPSNYEWRLLIDNTIIEATLEEAFHTDDENSSESNNIEDQEEEIGEKVDFKIFTHREGDALELFIATSISNKDLSIEVDQLPLSETIFANDPEFADPEESRKPEESSVHFLQRTLDQFFVRLPNHRLIILNIQETKDDCFFAWECNDSNQDILHGYCRCFKTKNGQAILNYITTAQLSEQNSAIWSNVLHQASVNQ